MNKFSLYAEILYLGFVYEKGRVHRKRWNVIYKRMLRKQLQLWSNIVLLMRDIPFSENDRAVLEDFLRLCEGDKKILAIYKIVSEKIIGFERNGFADITPGKGQNEESKVLIGLLHDLLGELDKEMEAVFFMPGEKAYYILRALHNVPRYFFYERQSEHLSTRINFQNAVSYCLSSLKQPLKQTYIDKYSFGGQMFGNNWIDDNG